MSILKNTLHDESISAASETTGTAEALNIEGGILQDCGNIKVVDGINIAAIKNEIDDLRIGNKYLSRIKNVVCA